MTKPKPNSNNSWHLAFGIYSVIGVQLALTTVAGLMGGHWLDQKWETTPWLTIVGLVLGAMGGFYNLIRITSWWQKKS